jgi:hypothetical protein
VPKNFLKHPAFLKAEVKLLKKKEFPKASLRQFWLHEPAI